MDVAQTARRFLISGRVQGVGYRAFVQHAASEIGVTGWVQNLDDGRVEAHANGPQEKLEDFEGRLRKGPQWSDVRGVDVAEVPVSKASGFHIR